MDAQDDGGAAPAIPTAAHAAGPPDGGAPTPLSFRSRKALITQAFSGLSMADLTNSLPELVSIALVSALSGPRTLNSDSDRVHRVESNALPATLLAAFGALANGMNRRIIVAEDAAAAVADAPVPTLPPSPEGVHDYASELLKYAIDYVGYSGRRRDELHGASSGDGDGLLSARNLFSDSLVKLLAPGKDPAPNESQKNLQRAVRRRTPDELRMIRKGFGNIRRTLTRAEYHRMRDNPTGLGQALEALDLAKNRETFMPRFQTEQSLEEVMHKAEVGARRKVRVQEKTMDIKRLGVLAFHDGSWRPARIESVTRGVHPTDGTAGLLQSATVTVFYPNDPQRSEGVEVQDLPRKSIRVRAMPWAKIDPGSVAWIPPEYTLGALLQYGFFQTNADGVEQLLVMLWDGTGQMRSETDHYHDITVGGILLPQGTDTDSSVLRLFVDFLSSNKDSRTLWDNWGADWARRWTEELKKDAWNATAEKRKIKSCLIADMKALWDLTASFPPNHFDPTDTYDVTNNVPKNMSRAYDHAAHRRFFLALPNKMTDRILKIHADWKQTGKYFNVKGKYALPHPPEFNLHGLLHLGRAIAQDFATLLELADACGMLMKLLVYLRTHCGISLIHHHESSVNGSGVWTIDVRQKVGVVLRQSQHPMTVQPKCYCGCGFAWPVQTPAGKHACESASVLMLMCRLTHADFLRTDPWQAGGIQEKSAEVHRVRAETHAAVMVELRGCSKSLKPSVLGHAAHGARYLHLMNDHGLRAACVKEDPIEVVHESILDLLKGVGRNFGGGLGTSCKQKGREVRLLVPIYYVSVGPSDLTFVLFWLCRC